MFPSASLWFYTGACLIFVDEGDLERDPDFSLWRPRDANLCQLGGAIADGCLLHSRRSSSCLPSRWCMGLPDCAALLAAVLYIIMIAPRHEAKTEGDGNPTIIQAQQRRKAMIQSCGRYTEWKTTPLSFGPCTMFCHFPKNRWYDFRITTRIDRR